jgi:hypothetical protein
MASRNNRRSPHAPLRRGPSIPGYVGEAGDDDHEHDPTDEDRTTAERVARRYLMSIEKAPSKDSMTFVLMGTVTAERVRDLLRENGVAVTAVEFVADPWPHMVQFVAYGPDGRRLPGSVTFEVHFIANTIGLTATVAVEPEGGAEDDDDGMPPAREA